MGAEPAQEKGRDGALRAKDWLDSTTRVRIIWDAYTTPAQVRIRRPDGSPKLFDLAGELYLDGRPKQLLVECKNYDTPGAQGTAYSEYLADAYFATLDQGSDAEIQFMWVTWHPFSQGKWLHLCGPADLGAEGALEALDATARMVAEAVEGHPALNGAPVEDHICRDVANRLWMVVLSERQEKHLTLDVATASEIRERFIREARDGRP